MDPVAAALAQLSGGVKIGNQITRPCIARRLDPPPVLPPRDPPIRQRKSVPDSWLSLELVEGKNRQVRRMTAAVGLPTLRLVRAGIGPWRVEGLAPGEWREVPRAEAEAVLAAGRVRTTGLAPRSASRVRGTARS